MTMTLELDAELADRLAALARERGVSAEAFALETLRSRLSVAEAAPQPSPDAWMQRLRSVARECGVPLSDWAVSREGLYED